MTPKPIAAIHHPDAVLFDLDGTIIDSRVPFARSLNHALQVHGYPQHEPASLYRFLGPPTPVTFRELIGSDDERQVAEAVATYRAHNRETGLADTTVYDGVRELLAHLHGQLPLAIATSKVSTMAKMLLDSLGLTDYFDVIGAPDPGPEAFGEPKRDTVANTLARLGSPARAVMVGDTRFDVEGAAACGLPTIGVLWGAGSEHELRAAGAAAIVTAPGEIPGLLGR